MVISYAWLMEYLPEPLEHDRLARILNSIGLEVEAYERHEEVKGGLEGLLVGHVLEVWQHPNADRLRMARVDTGGETPLQIVCGAPNVAAGQKVIVAPVGCTIHPVNGEPLTMKAARIRGMESQGMICAEDEVGLGDSHEGILVLPEHLLPGTPVADHFKPYSDHVISIGLTPNRSDAMSHLGVARDICAWLSHHLGRDVAVRSPLDGTLPEAGGDRAIRVDIEAPEACGRYAGLAIDGVRVAPSPAWLQQRLKAVGVRPINNIVDITNYVLHETGQPLHAFDADRIPGAGIRVMHLPAGTPFKALDGKERSIHADDLMICDAQGKGLCIAGVFGGADSGVSDETQTVFLESAWFDPTRIRRTSFRHGLRTDAATRFEKNVDISRTADVLKRAASLLCSIAGGRIASPVTDLYPGRKPPVQVSFTFAEVRSLSGKEYGAATISGILKALDFKVLAENGDGMTVEVPGHKTDISHAADITEEVMRIDGFDNIAIPSRISMTPAVDRSQAAETIRERLSGALTGMGFSEMLNNSITHSGHYSGEELKTAVRMMNSLSAELDTLRPSMLEPALQAVAHNLNRRNTDLRLYEFGKTYALAGEGAYAETEHLALFTTGNLSTGSWREKPREADLFDLKGTVASLFHYLGLPEPDYTPWNDGKTEFGLAGSIEGVPVVRLGRVAGATLRHFEIRQPVLYADLLWEACSRLALGVETRYREIPRFPSVTRDLAFVVHDGRSYGEVEAALRSIGLKRLVHHGLFDLFKSEKLGDGLKSMAMSFTFLDPGKTLTDEEVDGMMQEIIHTFEKRLEARIRRS